MDAWNDRLRALKDQERKAKNESETMLHQYRGGVKEEELRLRALREEERKKMQDAEKNLRNYRLAADAVKGEKKNKRQQPQHPIPPVEAKQDYDPLSSITPGFVSEQAGLFAAQKAEQERIAAEQAISMGHHRPTATSATSTEANGASRNQYNEMAENNGTQQQPQMPADSEKASTGNGAPTADSVEHLASNGHEPVSKMQIPSTPGDDKEGDKQQYQSGPADGHDDGTRTLPTIDTTSVPEPEQEQRAENETLVPDPSKDEAVVQHVSIDTTLDETENKTRAVSASPAEKPLEGHPTVVRLDVLFCFGLITLSSKPALDTYMMAVESVVQAQLEEDASVVGEHVKYNPVFPPFVKDTVLDENYVDPESRTDVQRFMVTAALPVFLSNGISVARARESITIELASAIRSGRFLQLARS